MLTPGMCLGHFEVLSPLGAGGMGEVYRARDERLDRDVAIKVVPTEVAGDAERLARFEREARALAKLSHPNILRIFELGEHEGVSFVVTELLEGDTLRERIGRGALPWRKAVGIAAHIADGLAAAHEAGIVHRDLKPENVFLTEDGRVKVLDFGLAKVDEGPVADLETVTSPSPGTLEGTVMGTVGYMAPEQVRGEVADGRCDIFALGCVLYEMLSGSSPFRRDTPMEIMAAVLKDEPPDLEDLGIDVGPELKRTVDRCLEKSPGQRFQAAGDLAFDLRSLVTSPGRTVGRGGGRRRAWIWAGLAALVLLVVVVTAVVFAPWGGERPQESATADRVLVLPFDNRTGDAALDPLSRMASDWITQGIARAEGIEAVPSTSVLVGQRAAGDAGPLASLAEKTRAGLVVTGAYYRQGEELQLQATITDVADDRIVAAVEPVRGDVAAPMDAIETVRRRVLGALALHVGSLHEIPYGLLRRAPLYEAYREFILGFELFLTDDRAALEHFERAAEIDPEFHTPLLYASFILYKAGRYERAGRVLREVREERDSFTPFGRHWIDALSAYTEHRYGEALRHLLEAERHALRDPMTVHWIVYMCVATNQPHRALEWIATYPEQPWGNHLMGNSWTSLHGWALHAAGEHERELRMARETLDGHPDWSAPRRHQVAALAALGRIEELAAAVEVGLTRPEIPDLGGWILLRGARELRAHGHRDASLDFAARAVAWCEGRPSTCRPTDDDVGLLVHALRYSERWNEAAARLALVGSESSSPEVIGVRGCLAARLGDSAEALDASEALGRLDDPYLFGRQTYWRACIAAVLGERDRAVALLERAIAEGLGYGSFLHTQIALENVWDEPAFQKLLSPAE